MHCRKYMHNTYYVHIRFIIFFPWYLGTSLMIFLNMLRPHPHAARREFRNSNPGTPLLPHALATWHLRRAVWGSPHSILIQTQIRRMAIRQENHQSHDLSRFLRHNIHILRKMHSSEVACTPYAHKCVSRRPFVVVERTTWPCLIVVLHSRACARGNEPINGCMSEVQT
jgi:hypothetical protein